MDKFSRGPRGFIGERGIQGPIGPSGGLQGETGLQGIQGVQGVQGPIGLNGASNFVVLDGVVVGINGGWRINLIDYSVSTIYVSIPSRANLVTISIITGNLNHDVVMIFKNNSANSTGIWNDLTAKKITTLTAGNSSTIVSSGMNSGICTWYVM